MAGPATAGARRPVRAGSTRRQPQQQRSRAKVDAILDATERLLADDTVELSTTQIADAAGVAVGTLYQYFDGVPDVIEALVARHAERFATLLQTELAGRRFRRKREAANAALDAVVAYYRDEPSFRALWRTAPRVLDAGFGDAADVLVGIVTGVLVEQGLADADDEDFAREAEVQWAVADALIRVAFRRDPAGDSAVLAHLRRLFDLDVRA